MADEDVKIPFFMDFRNIDQERKSLLDDLKEAAKEKSKIFKHEKYYTMLNKRDKFMAELDSKFEVLLREGDADKLFSYLKTLSPS